MPKFRIVQSRVDGKYQIERYFYTKRGNGFWSCVGDAQQHDTLERAEREIEHEMKCLDDVRNPVVIKEYGE